MANNSCDSVLVRDFRYEAATDSASSAWLKLVNRETFNQDRLSIIAKANAIIKLVPIGGQASYEEFSERRESYFEQQQYYSSSNSARYLVSQKVSPEAIEAWKQCKSQQVGFSCWVERSDDDSVEVVFKWTPPAGVLDGKVTRSTLLGGRAPDANNALAGEVFPVGFKFVPGASFSQIFTRNSPSQDFELNVVLNDGYGDALSIPGMTVVAPQPLMEPQGGISLDSAVVVELRAEHIYSQARNYMYAFVATGSVSNLILSNLVSQNLGLDFGYHFCQGEELFGRAGIRITVASMIQVPGNVKVRIALLQQRAEKYGPVEIHPRP